MSEAMIELAEKTLAGERDVMDASKGEVELAWLVAQLVCWPTRVDPDCTTNMRFLLNSAAKTIMSLSALRSRSEKGGTING